MRTGASVAPESSRSGSGRSTCCVRTTPTLPAPGRALARDTDGAPLEVQRFEERDAQPQQGRIAPVARAARSDAEDVLHPARPLAEQDDVVREVDGLVEVVRHEHQCRTVPRPGREEMVLQAHARERVERAEGLVEEEYLRLRHERAR